MPFLRKLLLLGLAVIATAVATPAYANIYARVTFNTYSEYRAWGDADLTGNPGPAYFTIFRANVPNAGNDYVAVPGNIILSGNVNGQLVDLGTTAGHFTANLSNNAGYQANGCVVSPINFFTSIHANNGDTFDITITCRPPPPVISSLLPNTGSSAGGTPVVITGTNLGGATAVRFGAANATSYTINSPTQITAIAPAGAGTVDVTVTTAGGTSASGAAGRFTYVSMPTVTGITPTSGPSAGGTTVVITGTNLSGATAVRFGATNATSYNVNGSTQITAIAPAGAGTVDVTVTTAVGTSAISAADRFTYLSAPTVTGLSPASGTVGTSVTVTGTNFTSASAVTFGATASSFTFINATTLTAIAPAGTGTVDVRVTTAAGTSATSAADQFTYLTPPVAGAVGLTVAYGSTNNPVTLNLGGGAATSVAVAGASAHGTAQAIGTSIVYTPAAGYAGPDSFTYTATNASGTSAPATVTVTVNPPAISYTPASPATAVMGVAYSQSLASAGGGTGPYTYAITSGALPAGMALAANGLLSGTPTVGGNFSFQVTATDSSTGTGPFSASSATLTLAVVAPTISVSPASLPGPTVGVAYTQALAASGGAAPYSYAIVAGALPPGLSLSQDGVLSGTPTAAGTFNVSVTATDANAFTGSHPYVLTVAAPTITLDPTSLANGRIGASYSQTISASGGTAPYSYAVTAGSLPSGLALSGAGVLSGTPSAAGSFSFTVTTTDSSTGAGPFTGSRSYNVSILSPALTLVPATLTGLAVGSAHTANIVAGGGTGPYNYFMYGGTVLPAGMSLSADGTLSGTPTAAGSYSFTIAATDSSTGAGAPFTVARAYNVTVGAPTLTLAPSSMPAATAAVAYSQALSASGGTAPYSYVVTSGTLPTGLALSAGGVLSGTPTATGTFNFTVSATDSSTGTGPFSTSQAYTLQVGAPVLSVGAVSATVGYGAAATPVTLAITGTPAAVAVATAPAHGTATVNGTSITYAPAAGYAGPDSFTYTASDAYSTSAPATVSITVASPTVAITTASLADATAGSAYTQTVAASGGAAPYSYAITAGALPAGLNLSSNGVLSGTPTAIGTFNFTVSATDSSTGTGPFSASQAYTLQVDAPALSVGAVSATVGYGAAATPVTLAITGTPTAVAVATAPAHGTATVNGTSITYAPAAGYAGPDSFTYTASDAYSTAAAATVSITVTAPALVLAPGSLPAAIASNAYAQALSASGGAAPYRYAVTAGTLPAGVTLSAGGELSGTPTVAGTFIVTITATDSSTGTGPFTASRSYTLQVDAPAIAVAPGTLPDAMGASDYRQAFTASGGVAPYRFTVLGGDLPAGLALAESGELAGTPTAAGRHAFTVQATDANGFTGSQAYTVMVEAAAQAIADFVATPVEPVYAPGGSFSVSARGGASGNPVVFAATTPAVCSVQGGTVTMLASGVCSLTADQAGNAVYQAAPQVRLDVAIAAAMPVLSWLADLGKVFGEDDFDLPDPQSTSPGAFTFTSSDAAVATVSGRTVHLVGEGTAVLVATQAASGSYTTASVQVQLVVSARPDPTTDAQVTGGLQAQVDAAVRFAQVQQANIRDRLRQVRNGHNPSSNNLTLAYAGSEHMPGLSVPVGQAAAGTIPAMPQGWGVWLAGTATFGTSGRNGSSGGAFDFDTGGITLGADRAFGERTLLGMAASWGRQGTDFDGTPSKVDADQRSLAVYGLWRAGEHLFLDGMLATGRLDYELARWSEVAGATAHARRDGDQWFGSLTFGYEHRNASGMSLTGYGRYDGHRSDLDAYAESGLGLYDLAYGRQRVDNSALAVGLEGDHPFKSGSASWRPFWTVEYRVALENQSDVAINYVQRPLGNDYTLAMRSYNDDTLALGAGMDLQLDSGWMFSLLLGHEQGRNSLRSNSIGLRLSFGSQPGVAPVYVDEPGLGYEDAGRERCRGDGARCDARGAGH